MDMALPVSGCAGMHFVQTAFPEVEQPVVLIGAKVVKVFEQTISKFLIAGGTGSPRFGQHGVVSPVVANPLLAKETLGAGAGGVSPPPLLPARELALGIRQLEKDGTWSEQRTIRSPSMQGHTE